MAWSRSRVLAPPDVKLDPERVTAMMKYNEALKDAGVLITLDGLHPPSMGARVTTRIYPGMGHTINEDEIAHLRQRAGRGPHALQGGGAV